MVAEAAPQAAETDQLDWTFWLAALVGLTLTALTMTLVLTSDLPGDRGLIAVGRALVIAVPVGIGLSLWRYRADKRVGQLLVVAGCIWFLPTLAESSNEVVYSVGRVGGWLVEPVLLYVILSVPSGRLAGRAERGGRCRASALLVLVLYLRQPSSSRATRSRSRSARAASTARPTPSCSRRSSRRSSTISSRRALHLGCPLRGASWSVLVRRYRASSQLAPHARARDRRRPPGRRRVLHHVHLAPAGRRELEPARRRRVGLPVDAARGRGRNPLGLLRSRLYAGEALQRLAVRPRHRRDRSPQTWPRRIAIGIASPSTPLRIVTADAVLG